MLVKRSSDLNYSDVTPKSVYVNRRKFLAQAAIGGGALLAGKALWDGAMEANMQEEFKNRIDEAVEKAEAFKPDPKELFEHVYSFMPQALKGEYDDAVTENFWQA